MRRQKRKDAAQLERRHRVMRHYLQNCTTREIAAKVGCTQATVVRDIKAVTQQWKDESRQGIAQRKQFALLQIRAIYREAMEAWRESKRPKQIITVLDCKNGTRKNASIVSERTEYRTGDASYLRAALDAIKQECRILGIDQPDIDPLAELLAQLPERFAQEVRAALAEMLAEEEKHAA